jgi:hypothetical protein
MAENLAGRASLVMSPETKRVAIDMARVAVKRSDRLETGIVVSSI